ncbi:MAG: D-alanine--D-alanine ligase [Nitrospinae bacterium]|nr:D-alanine--D-alanine ligase [Nitrospinota bacterium]
MKWKNKKIGVIMGGFSSEREISLKTGSAVAAALKEQGYDVAPIMAGRDLWEKIKESKIDIAFIALHGALGEDGAAQGLLEWMGIPYVGSGILGSALSMNKTIAKEIFIFHGIPTPDFQAIFRDDPDFMEKAKRDLKLPCIVKPASQGSTIGLSIVRREEELEAAILCAFKMDDEVLVEDFIDGRNLTVGIVGERALPIVEIKPKGGLYDYEAKYTKGKTDYLCPAPLSSEAARRCSELALQAHKVLRCRGLSRVDLMLDSGGNPFVLECNTLPGMTGTSLLPMAAKQAGMEFGVLLENILDTVK